MPTSAFSAPPREPLLKTAAVAAMSDTQRIAIVRELPGDLDTPVGAYLKLGRRPYTYLFESMQGGERWGRYSFIGLPCREVVRIRDGAITVERDGEIVETVQAAQPFEWLKAYAARSRVVADPRLPRFDGGLVGYAAYDCVRYFEPRVHCRKPDPLDTPDALFMRSDELVVFDNLRARLMLVTHAESDSAQERTAAEARLDGIEHALSQPLPPAPRRLEPPPDATGFRRGFDHDAYCAAAQRIKDYIGAGDVMQVVLAQRLSAPFVADEIALYRAIRMLNPSPYLYCMHLGDHQVVGSSPEILVRVEDGEMTVRPIAGTRPRGATPEADAALESELLADPKECAEHLMLIDLGRNDVGRVCETGSVQLTERMAIERYSHVMHIVSNVTGRLRAGVHALDALAASFPAGTLSGAPKVRAMEIIEELEPVRRGIYGGAVGYLSWSGNMDMAIAIRTAVIKDGMAHVQAGAGIVADSQPEAEWDECMNKAQAMLRAVGMAEGSR
jgi:anthranilate synthase component I